MAYIDYNVFNKKQDPFRPSHSEFIFTNELDVSLFHRMSDNYRFNAQAYQTLRIGDTVYSADLTRLKNAINISKLIINTREDIRDILEIVKDCPITQIFIGSFHPTTISFLQKMNQIDHLTIIGFNYTVEEYNILGDYLTTAFVTQVDICSDTYYLILQKYLHPNVNIKAQRVDIYNNASITTIQALSVSQGFINNTNGRHISHLIITGDVKYESQLFQHLIFFCLKNITISTSDFYNIGKWTSESTTMRQIEIINVDIDGYITYSDYKRFGSFLAKSTVTRLIMIHATEDAMNISALIQTLENNTILQYFKFHYPVANAKIIYTALQEMLSINHTLKVLDFPGGLQNGKPGVNPWDNPQYSDTDDNSDTWSEMCRIRSDSIKIRLNTYLTNIAKTLNRPDAGLEFFNIKGDRCCNFDHNHLHQNRSLIFMKNKDDHELLQNKSLIYFKTRICHASLITSHIRYLEVVIGSMFILNNWRQLMRENKTIEYLDLTHKDYSFHKTGFITAITENTSIKRCIIRSRTSEKHDFFNELATLIRSTTSIQQLIVYSVSWNKAIGMDWDNLCSALSANTSLHTLDLLFRERDNLYSVPDKFLEANPCVTVVISKKWSLTNIGTIIYEDMKTQAPYPLRKWNLMNIAADAVLKAQKVVPRDRVPEEVNDVLDHSKIFSN